MIFVTTGQKIAVENFSKGAIYKVTFTDESISYMMCVGIGKDFVMLQSTDPLLFSLTMQSASRVSTIDVHDPTPPEPPTPIENALQYQTGEPPFTFTTTENSLFSWYIEGEAGVKTANLFDKNATDTTKGYVLNSYINGNGIEISSEYYSISEYIDITGITNITISGMKTSSSGNSISAAFYNDSKTLISADSYGEGAERTYSVPANTKYVRLSYRTNMIDTVMLNSGTTALPYDGYGYKISISTNEHTTTIYLDEPIAEGEKLYSVNVDAQIVTDIGENTLSVSDPQPPEMQIVYGIYAEA